ncbi:fungal-specific transcription factor domain-containing protein [Apiosordaria backusii]|uniref:Fungal-specific transcription factor domain-containing protein n=1 Tax=Apiosordaria backusii TaxID=314023 RepID=A0AA40BN53_9PEZI|nr:fungal-specific transcription factor domain-containing protein [Apiosordaria backusii]
MEVSLNPPDDDMADRLTQQQFAPPTYTSLEVPYAPLVHRNALPETRIAEPGPKKKGKRKSTAAEADANGSTDSPKEKKQRISRSCDQCHGKRMKCSGFKPCNNCTKRERTCTYDRPYVRGIAKTPPPPPADGQARNLAQPVDEFGREVRDRSWALRACDLCRTQKVSCSGKLPCENCFNSRVACTFKLRAKQRDSMPPGEGGEEGEGEGEDSEAEGDGTELQNAQDGGNEATEYGGTFAVRRIPLQDHETYMLPHRYSDPETPPLAFLHKAWERMAYYCKTPSRYGQEFGVQGDLVLPLSDQPFDTTKPLEFPESPVKWFEMHNAFQNGWTETFHFLHRPTVKSWLERVWKNWTANVPLENDLGPAKATIALMCMSIGTMFYDRPWREAVRQKMWDRLWTLNMGDQLFLTTIRLTDAEPGPPKLESIQARLLQTLYLLCTCRLSQAWYIFGNAVHMLTQLGLHRRRGRNRGLGPDITDNPDYAKVQCERRTFWATYIIDKEISLMSGRPCHFSNEAVDQEFPDPVNDEDMGPEGPFRPHLGDCYLEAGTEQAKLNQIIDKVMRDVYTFREIPDEWRLESAWRLGNELEQWKDQLPFMMCHLKPSMLHTIFRRQSTLLTLAHCHAAILIYRPFMTAPNPADGDKKQTADSAVRKLIDAARVAVNMCLALARDQDKRDKSHFQAIFFAHHVCFCAAAVIFLLPHIRTRQAMYGGSHFRGYGKMDAKLTELAEKAIVALVGQTNRYSPSRRWAIILEELRDEAVRQVNGVGRTPAEQGQAQTQPEREASEEGSDEADDQSPNDQLLEDALRAHWEADLARHALPNQASAGEVTEPPPPPTVHRLWDKWKTTDWLDLDSAAFGPISNFEPPPPTPPSQPAPQPATSPLPAPQTDQNPVQ